MSSNVSGWDERQTAYKSMCDTIKGKYTVVHFALKGQIPQEFEDICGKVERREKDCDFLVIQLVRVLFSLSSPERLTNPKKDDKDIRARICAVLDNFPFWACLESDPAARNIEGLDNLCFWSENHILMLLGSSYLYRHWLKMHGPGVADSNTNNTKTNGNGNADVDRNADMGTTATGTTEQLEGTALQDHILHSYLDGHVRTQTIYEACSHVYIPYTFAGMS